MAQLGARLTGSQEVRGSNPLRSINLQIRCLRLLTFRRCAAVVCYPKSGGFKVSKIKSPQEKKRASIEFDRRNIYGENSKASRNNIRKGKQRSHMEERRSAKAKLLTVTGTPDEETSINAELRARQSLIHSKRDRFKKKPDMPLKEILLRKKMTGRRFMAVLSSTESLDRLKSKRPKP